MKPMNIIATYQSIESINKLDKVEMDMKCFSKSFNLSKREATSLLKFISLLKEQEVDSNCFNGYYVSYSINQISKEFDLLRFGHNSVINIELKAPLTQSDKFSKINKQMEQNYYYLQFLGKETHVYTYIENDGLYKFNIENKISEKIDIVELEKNLSEQQIDYSINPDNLFVPSNYLISPFNNTDKFLNGEYFLTDHQMEIKKNILSDIENNEHKIYCISANAGTGKTLLAYDLARSLMEHDKSSLIIHCGKLNQGHDKLKSQSWKIISIKFLYEEEFNENIELIIVDEAHRINLKQLEYIIINSSEFKIPIVFMYDTKQYLKENEKTDIYNYIKGKHKNLSVVQKRLTNKIRTNKEMASFIKNLINIGSSNSYLNYENVTVEYFDNFEDVSRYIKDLEDFYGWKAITFTNSLYDIEPIRSIACVCDTNAHDVIGQEFKKVVFVMDLNFRYNEKGVLTTTRNYYSAEGMLYQIVTRVVDELKIIVLNNIDLFIKLLEIKNICFNQSKL